MIRSILLIIFCLVFFIQTSAQNNFQAELEKRAFSISKTIGEDEITVINQIVQFEDHINKTETVTGKNKILLESSSKVLERILFSEAVYNNEVENKISIPDDELEAAFVNNNYILTFEVVRGSQELLKPAFRTTEKEFQKYKEAFDSEIMEISFGDVREDLEKDLFNMEIDWVSAAYKEKNDHLVFKLIKKEHKIILSENEAKKEDRKIQRILKSRQRTKLITQLRNKISTQKSSIKFNNKNKTEFINGLAAELNQLKSNNNLISFSSFTNSVNEKLLKLNIATVNKEIITGAEIVNFLKFSKIKLSSSFKRSISNLLDRYANLELIHNSKNLTSLKKKNNFNSILSVWDRCNNADAFSNGFLLKNNLNEKVFINDFLTSVEIDFLKVRNNSLLSTVISNLKSGRSFEELKKRYSQKTNYSVQSFLSSEKINYELFLSLMNKNEFYGLSDLVDGIIIYKITFKNNTEADVFKSKYNSVLKKVLNEINFVTSVEKINTNTNASSFFSRNGFGINYLKYPIIILN